MKWFVYVVRCRDGSLYTGITVDVDGRVAKHNDGTGARYTRARRPVALVFVHPCRTEREARRLEPRLKALPRADKLRLVDGDGAVLRALRRALTAPKKKRGAGAGAARAAARTATRTR